LIPLLFAILPGVRLGDLLTRAALRAMHAEEYDFEAVISGRTHLIAVCTLLLTFLVVVWTIESRLKSVPLATALKAGEEE
jgi:hypothetical protein